MQLADCRCQYVTYASACKAEQHYVAYLQRFYCAGRASRWLLFIGYLLWMLILFHALSEVAESFLVPAVEVRSCINTMLTQPSGMVWCCCDAQACLHALAKPSASVTAIMQLLLGTHIYPWHWKLSEVLWQWCSLSHSPYKGISNILVLCGAVDLRDYEAAACCGRRNTAVLCWWRTRPVHPAGCCLHRSNPPFCRQRPSFIPCCTMCINLAVSHV